MERSRQGGARKTQGPDLDLSPRDSAAGLVSRGRARGIRRDLRRLRGGPAVATLGRNERQPSVLAASRSLKSQWTLEKGRGKGASQTWYEVTLKDWFTICPDARIALNKSLNYPSAEGSK